MDSIQFPIKYYLKLDGSNADQNIDIGSYDFTTTGDLFASNLTLTVMLATPSIVTASVLDITAGTNLNLNSNVTVTGNITVGGDVDVTGSITGVNVTSGADPGHTHTGASLSGIDISADTNLAVTAPIVLTDDTLSHSAVAGYIHIPAGGVSNQILKNSGVAGTGAWGTVTENAGALANITTISMSNQLTSSLAIGTSPFAITSTTVNTNLNADLLDGKHVGTSGNAVPLLDGANTWSNTLTVGINGTGHDVRFWGDTADWGMLWDQSDDSLQLISTGAALDFTKLKFINGGEKASIYYFAGFAASSKGLYTTSASNMHFNANGGAGAIRFTAANVFMTDDVYLALGTGSLGTPDFKIGFKTADSTVQFLPMRPGLGNPPTAIVFNDGSKNTDFRIEGDGNTHTFFLDAGNDNITINATAVSEHYDLMLAGDGVLGLKETATPTADTNYGKIYCKNDDKLYFQDGAGAEHEVAFV